MEINVKIKFDKHHKTNTWDSPEMPYFLEPGLHARRPRHSPKSMREDSKLYSQKKEKEVNLTASSRKPNTARKASGSKIKL